MRCALLFVLSLYWISLLGLQGQEQQRPDNKSAKAISIYLTNKFHRKLNEMCSEPIEVRYQGVLSRPEGQRGLQLPDTVLDYTRWAIVGKPKEDRNGQVHELSRMLFSISISISDDKSAVGSCVIENTRLYICIHDIAGGKSLDDPLDVPSKITPRRLLGLLKLDPPEKKN